MPPQGWNEHVSEKGKFSVLLPGIPTPGYQPGDIEYIKYHRGQKKR